MNSEIADEFASYEEQIKKYCRGEMDETSGSGLRRKECQILGLSMGAC